jgi:hypothetical protein
VGGGGGDQARLYKYNGNLLQLCTFSVCGLSPAARISAGGKFLSARGNGKSAGGYSIHQQMEQAVEETKERVCYSVCTMDTFHNSLVTSEPTPLQDKSYIHLKTS